MYEFSLRRAWSYGYGFFAGRARGHVLLIVGLGVLLPFALQLLLLGRTIGMFRPPESAGEELLAGAEAAVGTALILGYALQIASWLGSLRLGLAREATLGRAALFGLGGAFFIVVGVIFLTILLGALFAAAAPALGALAVSAILLAVLAIVFPVVAALFAVAVALVLLLMIIVGASTGQVGLAATVVGGSGGVAVLIVVLAILLLWLTARLCCTTPLMAANKTFNLFGAVAASWRLTWEEQFRVMGYLALIGLVLAVAFVGGGVALGASLAATMAAGDAPELGIGADILALAAAIPIAFLSVMVPAGIHRELAGSAVSADVFA